MILSIEFLLDLLMTLSSFGALFIFFYFIYKKFKISSFLMRRISHIISAILVIFLSIYVSNHVIVVGSLLIIILFLIGLNWSIFDFLDKKDRRVGIFTYVISISIASFFFLPSNWIFFTYIILILGISDGLAGMGTYFSKSKEKKNGKTWTGSIFFAFSTFLISIIVSFFILENLIIILVLSIFMTLVLTFVERCFGGGWDNLFITIVTSIILFMLI